MSTLSRIIGIALSFAGLTSCSSSDDASDNSPVDEVAFSSCSYHSAGSLIPGTGDGINDTRIWAPDMISPFGNITAIARSQVYNPGGSASTNSDECSATNFEFPHRDTFCETRSANRDSYNCPQRTIHQGIDINAGTRSQCIQLREAKRAIGNGAAPEVANLIPIRAVMDGQISYIGRYTVDLRPSAGSITRFRYLHMNMRTLNVEFGSRVSKGDVIGFYFDDFGGNATTFHLHLEIIAFVDGSAQYVSPYASFIRAEEASKGISCQNIGA